MTCEWSAAAIDLMLLCNYRECESETSFPTETVKDVTSLCIASQALDIKKVRGPEPQSCANFLDII